MARLFLIALLWASAALAAPSYNRDYFGGGWLDLDTDGRDTRQEAVEQGMRFGVWVDPYSCEVVSNPLSLPINGDFDLDHIIPLKWAWEHGAWQWTQDEREAFANDPDNLFLVSASANRSKGAQGPSEWLPANVAFWPEYVEKWHMLIDKYALELPEADRQTLSRALDMGQLYKNGIRPDDILKHKTWIQRWIEATQ